MGVAIDSIVASSADLGGTGFVSLAPGGSSTFTVRSYVDGSKAYIEDIWAADSATKFQLSIKSPRLHDQVRGILLAGSNLIGSTANVKNPQQLMQGYVRQRIYSTDTLTIQASGADNDIFVAVLSLYYENLGGIQARLATWNQVEAMMVNEVGILVQPVASGTGGTVGTGVALNSVDNRLKANTDYALLGATCDIPVSGIFVNGTDTGNLDIAVPGSWDQAASSTYFIDKSVQYGRAGIPVINSNNQGSTLVKVVDDVASSAPNVTLLFAQLETFLNL